MTEEEGNLYITLAVLHGPSTVGDIHTVPIIDRGSHDPLHYGYGDRPWWVFRMGLNSREFATRAEAARHYCNHYGIAP